MKLFLLEEGFFYLIPILIIIWTVCKFLLSCIFLKKIQVNLLGLLYDYKIVYLSTFSILFDDDANDECMNESD